MLESLRKSVGSWVAKVFIGLLVISFAIWGIGDMFRGSSDRDVARVGSVRISIDQFRNLYQERLQLIARQLGRALTPDQARALGIDRQLLGELISESALDQKARSLGLNVPQELLIERIHANPLFRGPGGSFDLQRFYEVLRATGFTEARYVDSERRLLLRQQIGRALGGDLAPPKTLVDAVQRYENEERSVEFVSLGREQAGTVPAPTETELRNYFETNKAAFRAPEYRAVVLLPLTPELLAADIKITDAELRKAYEDRRQQFGTPERREVQQIVFPNVEEARAAAQRIASGTRFEDIVAERNLKPEDVALGFVTRREILDPAVAEAAFALAQDAVSAPIVGRFGAVLVRVTRIQPGTERKFEEVAEELRKQLALERARRELLDHHDKIEDERAGGATLAEAAAKTSLKAIRIAAVDRSGRTPEGKRIDEVPALDRVLEGVFGAQVGVETDPIDVRGGEGFVWYEVTAITPSRDRTFEEARDRVEARWRDDEIIKRLTARADAIRTRLEAGDKLAAAAPGLQLQAREKLRRDKTVEGIDRGTLAAIFETPEGKPAVAIAEDGVGRIVFRVTAVAVAVDPAAAGGRTNEIATGLQDDLLVQYVLRVQNELGVFVNEAALRSVTGASEK